MDADASPRAGDAVAEDFPFADASSFCAASLAAQSRALAALTHPQREPWLCLLEADPRRGRRELASRLRRAEERRLVKERRWRELLAIDEREGDGLRLAGVDEVGRGPLAGPVTAAALILPPAYHAPGLDDSKRMTPVARARWSLRLRRDAVAWSVADLDSARVDAIGIRRAVLEVMGRALAGLDPPPQRILVDGRDLPPGLCQASARALVGGDALSLAVAGASVLAKVHRDALMERFHERWPQYDFASNKGYGSFEHRRVIQLRGLCPIHRRSFCGAWLSDAERPRRAGATR